MNIQQRHDKIHNKIFASRLPTSEMKSLIKEHDELVRAIDDNRFHRTPIILNVGYPRYCYSIGFWGTQLGESDHIQEYVKSVTGLNGDVIWVDPTAGGCAIPQYIRRTGFARHTVLNDRVFLSACASRILLSNHSIPPLEHVESDVDSVLPVNGFTSNIQKFRDLFSIDVLNYMDGYCIRYLNRPEMLLALGCVLTKKHSYRSLHIDPNLCKTLTVEGNCLDPIKTKRLQRNGGTAVMYRPNLKDSIKGELRLIYRSRCNQGTGETYNLDMMEFSEIAIGDIMYCDFAWPWRDGRPVKEYSFPLLVSSILTQREPENTWYWTSETVLPGVNQFLRKVLPRFKFVVLNTQSSNFPNGDELKDSVAKYLGTDRVIDYAFNDYISRSATQTGSQKTYREYYVVVRGDLA